MSEAAQPDRAADRPSLEDRVTRLEEQYLHLRVPPVRDELLSLRGVHGARLAAIEARLTDIEQAVSERGWIGRRFGMIDDRFNSIDDALADIARRLPAAPSAD